MANATSDSAQTGTIPTGIESLDKLLGGGIPKGAIVLLAGNPGTGKTTIAAKILYEAIKRYNEPAMYISFVQSYKDFISQMNSIGMNFQELEEKGLFHYVEALTIVDEDALIAQLEEIMNMVVEKGISRIVLDSISAMLQIINNRARVREIVQNFFVSGLKPLGVISIIIAEHPYGAQVIGYGVEEFIVDAVIILRFTLEEGKLKRLIEVRKLRWAPINVAEALFHIRPGTVLTIYLPEEPVGLPEPSKVKTIGLWQSFQRLSRAGILTLLSNERCRSTMGETPRRRFERSSVQRDINEYLIRKNLGEVPAGHQILMVLLNSIGGHAQIASQLFASAVLLAQKNLKVGIVSFRSSPSAVKQKIRGLYKELNINPGDIDSNYLNRLSILSINPASFILEELMYKIQRFVEDKKLSVVIIEDLKLVFELLNKQRVLKNLYEFMLYAKRKQILSVYFMVNPTDENLLKTLQSIVDLYIEFDVQPLQIVMGESGGKHFSIIQPMTTYMYSAYGLFSLCLGLGVDKLDKAGFLVT
jgi:circadian clock protein KaiC